MENVYNGVQKYVLAKKFQLMLKMFIYGASNQNFEFLFLGTNFLFNLEPISLRYV